jgi:uncharacterized protein
MGRGGFADTSFWVALAARADRHHEAAVALWRRQATALATSNHVLGETWTFLNRRYGHQTALTMVGSVRGSPRVSVRHVSPETEDEAWRWLRQRSEREYSFVDATSFAFMRHHGIIEALAFDGDYSAAGFVELRP